MQILKIDGRLPTMNEIIKANRTNIYVGSIQKKRYTNLVMMECMAQEIAKVDGKIDLHITFCCKDKRIDKDNCIASTKFILDGLIKANVIKNDGWDEIGNIRYDFMIDKKHPCIYIELIEHKN